MKKIKLLFFFLATIFISNIFSQNQIGPVFKYSIDWEKAEVTISLTKETTAQELSPISPYITQKEIESILPSYIKLAIEKIQINSLKTISDLLVTEPQLNLHVLDLSDKIDNKVISYSHDLKSLTIYVKLKLFPFIAELLTKHHAAEELPKRLGWVAADSFSGLVIDARDTLPVYGTAKKAVLKPAIFPRILNDRGETILSSEMLTSDTLTKWGIAAYTASYDEKPFLSRIGQNPLRIKASAIFGKNHTDVVIPEEAVKLLLGKEENRKLLREGRILIICDSVRQEGP